MANALALGFFDGVHLGHAALLRETVDAARSGGLTPAVCTLDRSPAAVFGRGDGRLINSSSDRLYIFRRFFGVDAVYDLRFDEQLRSLSPTAFVEMLAEQYDARAVVAGYNYTFGLNASGSADTLCRDCAKYGIDCRIVDEVRVDGEAVSSTRVRRLLESGDTLAAQALLGHPHILGGTVAHGRSLGHTLGFPTANLPVPDGVLAPRYGVYAVRVDLGGVFRDGVANVGEKPTVGRAKVGVETNIFDFSDDIYGREIVIEFGEFLRPERRFDSVEELSAQVQRDRLAARDALSRSRRTTD